MARIRSIKPEFWDDRKLARAVSRSARLLYIGMWNFADEHSRLRADPAYLKGKILPYDDDLDEAAVDALVDELEVCGRVTRYAADDELYLHIPTMPKHQRLETNKVPSRLPEPPAQIGADKSARGADLPAPNTENPVSVQVTGSAQIGTDESAPIVVQQVAGSRLQVASSKEQVAGGGEGFVETVTSATAPVENDPPSNCSQHNGMGESAPACGGCKTAREYRDKILAARAATEKSDAAQQRAADTRAEIDGCDRCDDDGYRGLIVCRHGIELDADHIAQIRREASA